MEFTDYQRQDAQVRDWDPSALAVFDFVRSRIAAVLPTTTVEHIGSSAVPGLPGKGYVDVMVLPATEDAIAPVAHQLLRLGLQPARGSRPARPFCVGAVDDHSQVTNLHVHVIVAGSDEARAQHGLAQALRHDPALREQYAAIKQQAVDSGATDPAEYSMRKIHWVLVTLERLGLPPLPDPGRPPSGDQAKN